MEIRPLAAPSPGPQGLDALGATAAPAATADTQQASDSAASSTPLEPAVKLDIGTTNGKARYIQDPDTSTIVFQVVDRSSGTVIDQLPSETALRNRAYDSARETHRPQTGSVSRVA
ncbi:flagellar protein FlaG [Methylobacterium sp. E-005]|uniref:flagellar protein FlaG n=1 Tax=Methylobacterium sp. E-005 TaxID=2836549 RepID=UPI001FB9A375|nr:flagellar protein FlaG [Methylobacterium sp. E-005]MCJ2090433.1 flagellar protein FlaG [Methylobacterium sp. E-005]